MSMTNHPDNHEVVSPRHQNPDDIDFEAVRESLKQPPSLEMKAFLHKMLVANIANEADTENYRIPTGFNSGRATYVHRPSLRT